MKTSILLKFFAGLTIVNVLMINLLFAKDINVAMVTWRGETPAEKGFKEGLKELGYNANIVKFDAEQDKKKLTKVLREQILPIIGEFQYIYSFGTTVTKMTKKMLMNKVPHVFTIVAKPVASGVVKDMKKTGGNINGVSHTIPLKVQMEEISKIKKIKKLGFIFNPREDNSKQLLKSIKQVGKLMSFVVEGIRIPPDEKKLEASLGKIDESKFDAIYVPTDSFLISQAKVVGAILQKKKVITIGSHKKFITNGALLGLVADYSVLGKRAAQIVDKHMKGAKLDSFPVAVTEKPIFMINEATRKALGLELSKEILDTAKIVGN